MPHRVLTSLVAAGAAISLAACGSSGSDTPISQSVPSLTGTATTPTTATSPSTTALPTSPTTLPSTGGAPPSAPVTVNKTLADPAFGNTVTVIKYVVGYQPSAADLQRYGALGDEQVVLVDVKVTAGTKYYGSFGSDDFRLTGNPNGIDTTTDTILDGELTQAGYPPLKDADAGKSSTGWLVFLPQKTLAKYTLRLVRLAYKVSGGASIAAKNFDLPLN